MHTMREAREYPNDDFYHVGYYHPRNHEWVTLQTCYDFRSALKQVNFLNGGSGRLPPDGEESVLELVDEEQHDGKLPISTNKTQP